MQNSSTHALQGRGHVRGNVSLAWEVWPLCEFYDGSENV
jgi:hypothetical protein